MRRGISDFALKLVFRDWRLLPVSFTGLGIGGSIIGHVGSDAWSLTYTFILMGVMVAFTIIAKCISFAYTLYEKETAKLQAIRFIKGDGLNDGNTIIVLARADGFSKGQLITLFCESSGAKQPIFISEITAINPGEILAIPITDVPDEEIRKYFEEESRRKMLYATSEVSSENMIAQGFGAQND